MKAPLLPILLLPVAAACGGAAGERPPVVLVLFDALHAGHVSHLGYERGTTPHLDRLAAEGVSFARIFAPAPYTLASVPSILTGRLPDTHGLVHKRGELAQEEETLAELFSAAGYRTLGAVGNLNGGPAFALEQGFDELVEVYDGPGRLEQTVDGRTVHVAEVREFLPIVDRWLADRADERPLFLYLHVLEPHQPYAPPEAFRRRWLDPSYDGPFAGGDTETLVASLHGSIDAGPADVRATVDLYDATLAWADHNLGEIVARLREAGLYERAWIAVLSDHGEAFWQHGQWGHNEHLYDEQLHVPLVVKPPAGHPIGGGRVVEEMGSLVDVLPTLVDWLDLPEPHAPLDGRSLAGVAEGAEAAGAEERALVLRTRGRAPDVGLRTPSSKLILRADGDGRRGIELYDLVLDPAERADCSAERAEEIAADVRRLEALAEVAERVDAVGGGRGLSTAYEALLEKLGYVDW